METAKKGWLDSRQLARAQDGTLSASLSQGLYFDRTTMFDAQMEDRVRAVTLEEVNRAVKKWLDVSKMSIVKAGDFANH